MPDFSPALTIRRALEDEAGELSALSFVSKASWGYDDTFMEKVRPSFTITREYIARWPVYVLTDGSQRFGFYGFRVIDDTPFLCDMWLLPQHKGKGHGRAMWEHALQTARAQGYQSFHIESDPNAERFYRRMGATRIGEIRSGDSGRMLPLLEYRLGDQV